MTDSVPGVMLAGGKAARMGGGDKSLRQIGARRIIDHVIDRLGAQCAPLALNANGDPARLAGFGLPVLPDQMAGFPGPLAGVLAGLDWAAAMGHPAIVTAAADTPFFPADLVVRLRAAAGPSGLVLAACQDPEGRIWRQPTFGLWPVSLRNTLSAALVRGERKMALWAMHNGATTAAFADATPPAFFNINTPDDLVQATAYLIRP